jgi:hypothetical protein
VVLRYVAFEAVGVLVKLQAERYSLTVLRSMAHM